MQRGFARSEAARSKGVRSEVAPSKVAQSEVARSVGPGLELTQGRLIAAIAAGLGLAAACGGLADDDGLPDAPGTNPAGAAGSAARQPARSPATRPGSNAPASSMPASQVAPARDGETCYSRSRLAETAGLDAVLPLLPENAFDNNGCLSSIYSSWVNGGGCLYDPNDAVVRGDRCCYLLTTMDQGCGRPLIVDGAARVAPVAHGAAAWSQTGAPAGNAASASVTPLPSGSVARQIAEEWLLDARLEHASVASFSAFALSLLAVGAPAELVADCHLAAVDEVEHARACFALASRYAGEALGPGPLSLGGLELVADLEGLARRTWLDGCVEETIAALTAAAQLEVARDEAARVALTRIARDEARHAELAWKFTAWAIGRGGRSIQLVLSQLGEELAMTSSDRSPAVSNEELAALHAAGRLSPLERQAIRERALREVIQPALSRLLAEA
jgi:hypothetical protein